MNDTNCAIYANAEYISVRCLLREVLGHIHSGISSNLHLFDPEVLDLDSKGYHSELVLHFNGHFICCAV